MWKHWKKNFFLSYRNLEHVLVTSWNDVRCELALKQRQSVFSMTWVTKERQTDGCPQYGVIIVSCAKIGKLIATHFAEEDHEGETSSRSQCVLFILFIPFKENEFYSKTAQSWTQKPNPWLAFWCTIKDKEECKKLGGLATTRKNIVHGLPGSQENRAYRMIEECPSNMKTHES